MLEVVLLEKPSRHCMHGGFGLFGYANAVGIELLPKIPGRINVHPHHDRLKKLVMTISLEAELRGDSRHTAGILVVRQTEAEQGR